MKFALKNQLKNSLLILSLVASPLASANWCTGKDFYLIEMELADRLIKAQQTIREQQKDIHRTQLQLQYDDTTPAEALKQELYNSVQSLQKRTQTQCKQSREKQTGLRLQVTQLIHYKQLYKDLDESLTTHKTIGDELIRANNELEIAHTALQAPNQSLKKALGIISAACLTVKYSKKVVEKFQPIDIEGIKKSQHDVDDLQKVMDQYQLLSQPSNALCSSFAKFSLEEDKTKSSWWQKLNTKVKSIF